MQKLTPDSFVSGVIRGWTPEVFLLLRWIWPKHHVYVCMSLSLLHAYLHIPLPTLRNMQKPPKTSWKRNRIDNYRCLLCINLVGCFPHLPFVSNTCCSCRGVQGRGEDGMHALCEGGCHKGFGLLWVPCSWRVRLPCSAAAASRNWCRSSDISL